MKYLQMYLHAIASNHTHFLGTDCYDPSSHKLQPIELFTYVAPSRGEALLLNIKRS